MSYEIELKALCDDCDGLRGKLSRLNAEFIRLEKQSDTYYNHPGKDFALTDEALRIRVVNGISMLTYKGPRLKGPVKTRIEKEVEVSDPLSMGAILEYLGFARNIDVKKEREVHKLGDVTICLDRVEGAGMFVEFEMISADREYAEKELLSLAEKTGFNTFEKRSYLQILLDTIKGEKNNQK